MAGVGVHQSSHGADPWPEDPSLWAPLCLSLACTLSRVEGVLRLVQLAQGGSVSPK